MTTDQEFKVKTPHERKFLVWTYEHSQKFGDYLVRNPLGRVVNHFDKEDDAIIMCDSLNRGVTRSVA